jgi:methionyl-tRNA formyltransferase
MVFLGTAELACASLAGLRSAAFTEVVAVVTQPDRPKGRDLKLQASPVKQLAQRLGLPVLQPERARSPEFVVQLQALRPDLIVVAAYGQILPQAILDVPRLGCVNVHTSLLPKYRGAAPIQWAILNDESETGVTIMKMDAGLDTGPILMQETTLIQPGDDAQSLHDRLAQMGANLLVATLPDYAVGKLAIRAQPAEGASYARKITKEDGRLDWGQPARALWNRIRGFKPWPGAFTFLAVQPQPRLLKIWEAEVLEGVVGEPGFVLQADKSGLTIGCGSGALRVRSLQLEGSRRLGVLEFLSGHPLVPGEKLD